MLNTCRLCGQSFYLPTKVERKLKETCGCSVAASIPRSLHADRSRIDPAGPIGI
ncbi:hypothetical protein QT982_12455 [Microcoleus sp. herbarium2]